ncbi:MAG: dinitrogenase iron-molybdenum cofactor biosynthesis protein [archaeon]|nr:dinitrogenase iron-molybdenum cofactor biosynthesis protein [archaeon]
MEKVAVTYENGEVFQHFGHSPQFKIYKVENNKILSSEIVETGGSGHGELVDVLTSHDTKILICGGIGGGAKNMLSEAGIMVYAGANGSADSQVEAFLAGKFDFCREATCNKDSHCRHH